MEKVAITGKVIGCDKRLSLSKHETNWSYVSFQEISGSVTNVEHVRAQGPIAATMSIGQSGTFYFISKNPRLIYGVRHSNGRPDPASKRSLALPAIGTIWSLAALFILIGFLTLPMFLIALSRNWQFNRAIDEEFGTDEGNSAGPSGKTRTI